MKKPNVAFFDFADCEGCQLQIANLGETLLSVLGAIDVVEFREVMSEKWDKDYDIAIIEGSITTPHAEERIKRIRERSKYIMTIGSCATIGGINGMKNKFSDEEIKNYVYGDGGRFFRTDEVKAIHQVIKVDYVVTGCPIYLPEFVTVLKCALLGKPYHVPDDAVCTECKLNENECMYDKGITCLGPYTKAGCNSWCMNNGNICYGCRGLVSNPNEKGGKDILEKYKISKDLAENKFDMYNKCREIDEREKEKH